MWWCARCGNPPDMEVDTYKFELKQLRQQNPQLKTAKEKVNEKLNAMVETVKTAQNASSDLKKQAKEISTELVAGKKRIKAAMALERGFT